uniref:Uncharacterized protein n=2 Tax=Borrelia hermsii TaxID=140 RepID=T1EC83_BORHE|nr:hypothetical protein BHA039 [Borrelia hermsii]
MCMLLKPICLLSCLLFSVKIKYKIKHENKEISLFRSVSDLFFEKISEILNLGAG